MSCNAWNHPPDCNCGWGGVFYSLGEGSAPLQWPLRNGGFLNPNADCPKCKQKVFFYRSTNGGSVYFDSLGPPWPKHPCMADVQQVATPTSAYWEAMSLLAGVFRKPSLEALTGSSNKFFAWILERTSAAVSNGNFRVAVAYWVASLPPAALGCKDIELQSMTQEKAYEMALCVMRYSVGVKTTGPRKVAKELAEQIVKRAEEKLARRKKSLC